MSPDASEKFNQMTDEELESALSKAGQGAHLALSILMKRRASEIRISVNELKEAIKGFSYSSEKYSKKIVWLTRVLVILTVVIGILTGIMAFK
jgi:hypothetical protein